MPSHHITALFLGLLLLGTSPLSAHFLWVVSKVDGPKPTAKVYFSEMAAPDDPDLLDRVLKAEVWSIGQRGEAKPLKLTKEADALSVELTAQQREAPVVLKYCYGVLSRDNESFLLNYYAKTYPRALPGSWPAVEDANLLPLEVVPVVNGAEMKFEVLWQAKRQEGATVTVEGPGLDQKIEGTTDASGTFRCVLPEAGLYSIRARFSEAKAGERDGMKYDSVRHYSTLALNFAPASLKSAATGLPELPKGITSFGGAVAGDWLYVYGGHYGRAHGYSREEQSGDFLRLNLREPGAWESLPGGPKLTGLALVPHRGKLYRIGGFTAKNGESAAQDLWSQADVARFDPATRQWETLPALPEGRSSHDAALIGDVLYVVGGWELRGGESSRWHDTAWKLDLASQPLGWKPIANPPSRRRALAAASLGGRLYCIGGMSEGSETLLSVAVYDPSKNEWSAGPDLAGSGMDGFGSAAIACGGRLYATTMSGAVERLSADGSHWDYAGQLQNPRFFHRLLPWKNDHLIAVGGASMSSGKTRVVESLQAPGTTVSK